MTEYHVHLTQAQHNKSLADVLARRRPYHDWAITSAFYAAIHYFEGWLSVNTPEQHTETSIPVDSDGNPRYSLHSWREELVRNNIDRTAFICYRTLRQASNTARYLTTLPPPNADAGWLRLRASDYFSLEDVANLMRCLAELENELGFGQANDNQ